MVPVATDKRTMQDSRIPDPEEDDAPGQEQAVAIRPRCVEHTPVLQTVPSALHVVSPTLHAELFKNILFGRYYAPFYYPSLRRINLIIN